MAGRSHNVKEITVPTWLHDDIRTIARAQRRTIADVARELITFGLQHDPRVRTPTTDHPRTTIDQAAAALRSPTSTTRRPP
jgi:hypothetical protein